MTRLSIQHSAINLSQGFPNEPPTPTVVNALVRAILGGTPERAASLTNFSQDTALAPIDALNQYSPPMGRTELRNAISNQYERIYSWNVNPDEITVTLGATEALASALRTVGRVGDKIAIIEPFHESYPNQCGLFHLEPIYVTLALKGGEWTLDWDELEEAMRVARAIVLNSPHNPTGKVFSREELRRVAELAVRHDTFVITDEIYEHMCLSGEHYVLPKEFPFARHLVFVCNSVGKSASATGWRVGWCVHPKEYTTAYRAVHDQMVVMAPHPMQYATETFLKLPLQYFTEMPKKYARRVEILRNALHEVGFGVGVPEGAYYLFAKYKGVNALRDLGPMEAAMYMIEKVGVACVPGDNFYGMANDGRDFLRFAACRSIADIEEACARLLVLR